MNGFTAADRATFHQAVTPELVNSILLDFPPRLVTVDSRLLQIALMSCVSWAWDDGWEAAMRMAASAVGDEIPPDNLMAECAQPSTQTLLARNLFERILSEGLPATAGS